VKAPTANKRSLAQRQHDKAEIAAGYLRGERQADMAARLGISRQEVTYELGVLRKEWLARSSRDFDQKKSEELAKLDELETEYWAAWQASKQPLEHTTQEEVTDEISMPAGRRHTRVKVPRSRTRAATQQQQQHGDTSCLAGVERVIRERCKLLGLYPATDVTVSGVMTFNDLFELAQQADPPRVTAVTLPAGQHGNGHGHHDGDTLLQ
jgi:hypothetical protein